MNARTLILTTLLIAGASITDAGKIPTDTTFTGVWTGVNGRHGPGSTGGTLSFSTATDIQKGLSPGATAITGSVVVPLLRDGGFETRPVTGFITAKGRIHAKFKGGFFNGHTDAGGHDAGGFMYVNVQRYRAVSFWFADQGGTPPTAE
jgi:hypothetical protein